LSGPPGRNDTILFFTDDRLIQECARCEAYPAIPPTALRDIAVELYGPQKTDQLAPERALAFSMHELKDFNISVSSAVSATPEILDTAATPEVTATPAFDINTALRVRDAISQSTWIVFGMLDLNPDVPTARAFRDFLANQADVLTDKRVIVFAFGAPYYLDPTEVSNITAYYGVYSRMPSALDAATRVLFGELTPMGQSPVSIDGTQYLLSERTRPDPTQRITLSALDALTATYKIGDKIEVIAGPILDRNGFIVPDNTEVEFILTYPNEGVTQPQEPVLTRDGLARILLTIERQAVLNITAKADETEDSDTIRINAAETVSIERIQPTTAPTVTPLPSPMPTLVPTPIPAPPQPEPPPIVRTTLGGFVFTLLILLGVGVATFVVLSGFRQVETNLRLRGVLSTWICGWLGYVLYAFGAPGTGRLGGAFGWVGGPMLAGVIALLTFGLVTIFIRLQRNEMA
jgi:beta-N-acetylhexosaminidase